MAETMQVEEDTWMPAEPVTRVEDVQRRDETHVPASSQYIMTQSPTLPSTSIVGNMPVTDAGMKQSIRLAEIMQAETASSDLAAQDKPEREEDERQAYETDVPASPGSVVKKHDVERIGQERPGTSANQQAGSYLWSQAGISQPSYGQRWPGLSEAREHKQVEMPWPSLPDDTPVDGEDWEMARRAWERQRRLDEEQRGSSWNA
jgi:hypothetical protein